MTIPGFSRMTFIGNVGMVPLVIFDTPTGAMWLFPQAIAITQIWEARFHFNNN